MKIIYTALFVKDIPELIKRFPPKHTRVFGHHSTVAFKPTSLGSIEVGKESKIKILGRVFDEKGDALLVENSKSENINPHITLSCAEGVTPFYSSELIEKALANKTVELFSSNEEVTVIDGYYDGTRDILLQ